MKLDATSTKTKRTNSLAFAQTDCHTCASQGQRCDRRRPQCSTCLDQGRKCGGFATPLSWDPKRMWSDNQTTTIGDSPTDNTDMQPITSYNPPPSSGRSRFRFVKGAPRPRKRRKACPPRSQSGVQEDLSLATPNVLPREAGENSELLDHIQTASYPEDLGMIVFD